MALLDGINYSQVKNEWKDIVHGDDNLEKLYTGIQKMAHVVAGTMGARGRTVIIHDGTKGTSHSTKDGVSVAKEVFLKDDIENIGANMAKEVAEKVVKAAGDGTTTCMVLTNAFCNIGIKLLKDKVQPFEILAALDYIQNEMRIVLEDCTNELVTEEEVYNVAKIASNHDDAIAKLVFDALQMTDKDTVINLERGGTYESKVNMLDGYSFNRGYYNHNFKPENKLAAEHDNPIIFITCEELVGRYDVEPLLQIAQDENRPLVIICKDMVQDAYNLVVLNKLRMAFPVLVIKAPRFGEEQLNALEDIAAYTGGKVFGRNDGFAMTSIQLDDFGECDTIKAGSDYTHIFGGHANPDALKSRINGLKYRLEDVTDRDKHEHFIHDIQERISKLDGGICTIEVGGRTQVEQNEKFDRVEDALLATKSAIESGYVTGGGSLYFHMAQEIKRKSTNELERMLAVALYSPMSTILNNGYIGETMDDFAAVYEDAIPSDAPEWGVNVITGEIVNNIESGIIDSAKIAESIIEVVISFCKTFLSSHATIVHKLEYFDKIQ